MEDKIINIEKFVAGHYEKSLGFKYFVPKEINFQWNWTDPVLNTLLEKASIKLGELNSFARLVPNIDLFIQLHVTKEAVVSSKIEGTKTDMDEAVLPVEEIKVERINDWVEVQNYIKALNNSIENEKTLPLSSRLLKHAHSILLKEVRGENKSPGEFRNSQNWIGGASLMDAVFIPPAQHFVNPLMGDLENFLHNDKIQVPALIRIGIAHYQFETIHPFLDGNGRIGRLLITLFLVSHKILDRPLLYLSAFFQKNKTLYYDNLTRVRDKNDMLHWLKYFLTGIEETSRKAVETLSAIMKLKTDIDLEIQQMGRRSHSAFKVITSLFENPVITPKQVEQICGHTKKTSYELVAIFEKKGWLKKIGEGERNRVYIFTPYLNLFD